MQDFDEFKNALFTPLHRCAENSVDQHRVNCDQCYLDLQKCQKDLLTCFQKLAKANTIVPLNHCEPSTRNTPCPVKCVYSVRSNPGGNSCKDPATTNLCSGRANRYPNCLCVNSPNLRGGRTARPRNRTVRGLGRRTRPWNTNARPPMYPSQHCAGDW